MNLLVSNRECCGSSKGLIDDLPPDLFVRGLENERAAIEDYFRVKLPVVNAGNSSYCASLSCVIGLLPVIWIPGVLCAICSCAKAEHQAWDTKLRQWADALNRNILFRYGMLIKPQSRCDAVWVFDGNGGHKERYIERWMAIALTPEESAKLASEPHLIGDIEDCTCCSGSNEYSYIMHP